MTTNELCELLREKNEMNIHPLVSKMTQLLCEAYETGINVGVEIAEKIHEMNSHEIH